MPKNALILLKNLKNRRALGDPPLTSLPPVAEGFTPNSPASGGWEFRPQTSNGLRRLGTPPPDPLQLYFLFIYLFIFSTLFLFIHFSLL